MAGKLDAGPNLLFGVELLLIVLILLESALLFAAPSRYGKVYMSIEESQLTIAYNALILILLTRWASETVDGHGLGPKMWV